MGPFVGEPCTSDADCGATGACGWDDAHTTGMCICKIGLEVCLGQCFDMGSDPSNCGACGHVCDAGAACDHGVCEGDVHFSATFDSPITVSRHPTNACTNADEAAVTTSANDFSGGTAFLAHNYTNPNNANAPPVAYDIGDPTMAETWQEESPIQRVPRDFSARHDGWCVRADPTTTTSGMTGFEYVGAIMRKVDGDCVTGTEKRERCIGVGASTLSNLFAGSTFWDFGMQCINLDDDRVPPGTQGGWDGPVIEFSPMSPQLYVVASVDGNDGGPTGIRNELWVYRSSNCSPGAPGSAQCPIDSINPPLAGTTTPVAIPIAQTHIGLAVNPANGEGIIAYRDAFFNLVIDRVPISGAWTPSAITVVSPWHFHPNDGCIENASETYSCKQAGALCHCTAGLDSTFVRVCSDNLGSEKCSIMIAHPKLQTKLAADGHAYLYIGFDESVKHFGNHRFQANMLVYDVTNWTAGVPPILVGSPAGRSVQTWQSTPAMSAHDEVYGWFFYKDQQGAADGGDMCNMEFVGCVTTDPTLETGLTCKRVSDGTFPMIIADSQDFYGEYITASRRGISGGVLATWAQAVPVTNACISCTTDGGTTFKDFAQVIKAAHVTIP